MKTRERLQKLLDLRNDPRPLVRFAWWGAVAVFCALLISPEDSPVPGGKVLRGLWWVWNLGLLSVTVAIGLFRTRGMIRGAGASFRWSFWGSLIAFFWVLLSANKLFSLYATRLSLPASIAGLGVFLALLAAPIAFAGLFLIGLIGSAFGVVAARNRSDYGPAAAAGVSRLWIGVMFVLLLMALAKALRLPDSALWAIPAGLPTYIALLGTRSDTAHAIPWDIGTGIGRLLTRWFIHRGRFGRRIVFWDFRGPVLGLLAGVAGLALNTLSLLEPLQAAELLQIVKLNSTLNLRVLSDEPDPMYAATEFVLLKMDEQTRRRIAEGASEPEVQAAMIRKLTDLGAQWIVLPAPVTVAPDMATEFVNIGVASEPDQPPIDAGTVERAGRDMAKLLAAVTSSGRVVLAVQAGFYEDPPLPPTPPNARRGRSLSAPKRILEASAARAESRPSSKLRLAAAALGHVNLDAMGSPQLPLIPLDDMPLPSLPVELVASIKEQEARGKPWTYPQRFRDLPQLKADRVLVRFQDTRAGIAFPILEYATVMAGGKIYQRKLIAGQETMEDRGAWEQPKDYFRNKVVFLDSLVPAYRESPLGLMPQNELLAHAAQTLLQGAGFRVLPPILQLLLTLLLPALVGILCTGRDPFGAGWRLALTIGILATSATLVAFNEVWVDPVAPIAGCILAYVLVTQLTYANNESDRDLLRRFAAPQVIEELLRRPDMLALGGSRQKLCVLFADVRGFTIFTEQHRDEPERVIETINAYTSAMTEALFDFKGVLDKYTGDGLMAFFPVDEKESDAVAASRAVRAALAMRDATEVVTTRLRAADLQPLHVGIGMHFGEAVVGLVGNLNQFNYTALGFTVVVAARLQTLAEGGEVIVSPELEKLVRHEFVTEAMRAVEVKGVSEPVTPYRVLRPGLAEGQRPLGLASGPDSQGDCPALD